MFWKSLGSKGFTPGAGSPGLYLSSQCHEGGMGARGGGHPGGPWCVHPCARASVRVGTGIRADGTANSRHKVPVGVDRVVGPRLEGGILGRAKGRTGTWTRENLPWGQGQGQVRAFSPAYGSSPTTGRGRAGPQGQGSLVWRALAGQILQVGSHPA